MTGHSLKVEALRLVCAQLEVELQVLQAAVDSATTAATHAESKAENKYDTRGLEASYLAGAQAERAAELRSALARLRAAVLGPWTAGAPVAALALVELGSEEQSSSRYLLLPIAGGYSVSVDGVVIKTLTAATPLGRALLGKRVGDGLVLTTAQGDKEYDVLAVE